MKSAVNDSWAKVLQNDNLQYYHQKTSGVWNGIHEFGPNFVHWMQLQLRLTKQLETITFRVKSGENYTFAYKCAEIFWFGSSVENRTDDRNRGMFSIGRENCIYIGHQKEKFGWKFDNAVMPNVIDVSHWKFKKKSSETFDFIFCLIS